MQGYLDDPAATAAAIDDRGYLHTGDLATMDDRGYVSIVGRLKDMIIVGGFNVYPVEVENTCSPTRRSAQVAVIGVPDDRMGEVAMAWIVPAPGRDADAGGRHRLVATAAWPTTRCPATCAFIDALPINAGGQGREGTRSARGRASELAAT